ncbi:MAG: hypothetical protein QNL92_10465 [Octadecabacter sp.]
MKYLLFALPIVSLISIPIGAAAQQSLINGATSDPIVMEGGYGDDTVMNFTTADIDQVPTVTPTCENLSLPADQCPAQDDLVILSTE